jgi:hypothetical protein
MNRIADGPQPPPSQERPAGELAKQLSEQVSALVRAATAWQAAPEGVRRTVSNGASTANKRGIPLAAAAATLIASYLALRWWRKR